MRWFSRKLYLHSHNNANSVDLGTSSMASPVSQMVKNLPEMWENCLTWVGKIPWRRERLPAPFLIVRAVGPKLPSVPLGPPAACRAPLRLSRPRGSAVLVLRLLQGAACLLLDVWGPAQLCCVISNPKIH